MLVAVVWLTIFSLVDLVQAHVDGLGTGDGPPVVVSQQARVRVGLSGQQGHGGAEYAIGQGWFTEQGLDIEPVTMPGNVGALLAVVGGSADIAGTNVFAHLWLREQGVDVRAIAADAAEERANPIHAILVPGNSAIQTASDLEGKRLGISGNNSNDRVMVQAWLESQGADPSQVELVEMPESVQWRALLEGRVDAVSAAEPLATTGLAGGARLLAHHYADLNASTVLSYYVATGDWLNRNADVVRRFARAVHRANAALEANPELKHQAAQERLGISAELAGRVHQPTLQTRIDPAAIQWWADAGVRMGFIQRPLNAQDLLADTAR